MPVTTSPPRVRKLAYHAVPTRLEREREATGKDGNLPTDLAEIGPWILGDMLGKGSSGRVKLGKHRYSGKMAAIKIISKNPVFSSKQTLDELYARHQKQLQAIHREIVIMKLINHPCIMALYDLQETETEFYLALEYVEGGELFDYIISKGRLSESEVLFYFRQILYGLDYCHRFNISHRDLKPENILLDKHMNIKIADFGMAALEVANGMLQTSCGSPHYASPEIVAVRQIFRHPFFKGPTSRIFINPPPPSLEELAMPIGQTERIERVYIENLVLLFHKSPSELEYALRAKNPSWEKAFLYLLRRYAERVRENYGEDGEYEEPAGVFADVTNVVPRRRRDIFAKPRPPVWAAGGVKMERSDRPRPMSLGGRRDEVWAPRDEVLRKGSYDEPVKSREGGSRLVKEEPVLRHSRDESASRQSRDETAPRQSREDPTPRHSREESSRRSRPPSVIGPRPNVASPSKIRTAPVSPSKISASRPVPEVPHSRLNPMAQEFESVFQDAVLGPEPFRSVLSPDIDGGFAIDPRCWSNEDPPTRRTSQDRNPSEDQNRQVAKRSTLSPHAEPFILGSLGQPSAKPARKGKPAPLSLNNPNWQAVSSVSQPGTPGIDSPKMGQQPKVTGWFTNLFTFKPVYHVLYSTASIELTARECTRVLTTFGIQVLKVEGQDLLRCNVERFHDLDGALVNKPVKFRIEVKSNSRMLDSPRFDVPGTPLSASTATSPYPCVLVMTQEKGAHSTLKAVYARLRAMWRLDALVSPMPVTPMMG
ncbi:hypothetical protein RSOLAG22IIIB_08832 [Rhizoctonia solani]|uniref:Protein kinase domain-containing protein n=1 Tax=Rhizoctonia solani TaxID=456999 RepID=A0A0K6FUN7_9AGAM|nr:hypothetical protein RSOLAG22IIIB_08832 [Rhizoctonia solani]